MAHLPEDKLLALRELIHSWMPCHWCRKRELESLNGWLYPGMSAATDLEVKSDAPGAIGFGVYSRGQWFYGAWLTVQARHGDCCSPLGIFVVQEAGPFSSDNEAVVAILMTRTSKVPALMHLLHDLLLLAARWGFTFTAAHVPGVEN